MCYDTFTEVLMRFGIHVPKQADLPATARYAAEIGCETIQVFSGNPMSWTTGALDARERETFIEEIERARIGPVLLHTPYLINLATPDRRLQANSLRGLTAAMVRAHELSARTVIVHCGNHMGAGTDAGIDRAVHMLERALDRTPPESTVSLENGAGKGTEIGLSVDELARLVAPFPRERVGIVLDTAHLWALGYDLRAARAVEEMLDEFEGGPGLSRLWAIHANDSLAELGSRRDRHSLWSEGVMGMRALRLLVRTPRLSGMPMIFEVPGDTADFDRKRLRRMRRLDREARRREAAG